MCCYKYKYVYWCAFVFVWLFVVLHAAARPARFLIGGESEGYNSSQIKMAFKTNFFCNWTRKKIVNFGIFFSKKNIRLIIMNDQEAKKKKNTFFVSWVLILFSFFIWKERNKWERGRNLKFGGDGERGGGTIYPPLIYFFVVYFILPSLSLKSSLLPKLEDPITPTLRGYVITYGPTWKRKKKNARPSLFQFFYLWDSTSGCYSLKEKKNKTIFPSSFILKVW